jgi:hypothetical protein
MHAVAALIHSPFLRTESALSLVYLLGRAETECMQFDASPSVAPLLRELCAHTGLYMQEERGHDRHSFSIGKHASTTRFMLEKRRSTLPDDRRALGLLAGYPRTAVYAHAAGTGHAPGASSALARARGFAPALHFTLSRTHTEEELTHVEYELLPLIKQIAPQVYREVLQAQYLDTIHLPHVALPQERSVLELP